LATAARVKYPAALQRCKFDTPLLAAGSLIVFKDKLILRNFHAILSCEKKTEGGGKYDLPFSDWLKQRTLYKVWCLDEICTEVKTIVHIGFCTFYSEKIKNRMEKIQWKKNHLRNILFCG